jgi:2-methylcitrate dehydratase
MLLLLLLIFSLLLKAGKVPGSNDEVWKTLMLSPYDYGSAALTDADTRSLMHKTSFAHGGKEYDDKYPEGIPTSIELTLKGGKVVSSGLVMFPSGHARDTKADLQAILDHKNKLLGDLVFKQGAARETFVKALQEMKSAKNLTDLYLFDWDGQVSHPPIDGPPAKL